MLFYTKSYICNLCNSVHKISIYIIFKQWSFKQKVYHTTNNQRSISFLMLLQISLYFSFFFFLFLCKDLPFLSYNSHPRLLQTRCLGTYFLSPSIRLISLEVSLLIAVSLCNAQVGWESSLTRALFQNGFLSDTCPKDLSLYCLYDFEFSRCSNMKLWVSKGNILWEMLYWIKHSKFY